jgi:hypothetical protein
MRFAIDIFLSRDSGTPTVAPRQPLPDPLPADRRIWTVHGAYFPDADHADVAEWGLRHARDRFGTLQMHASVRVERIPGID